MKKMALVVLSVLFAAGAAFADAAPMLMGKIKSITPAVAPMGHTQLVIVDNAGKETKLSLSKHTTISDKSGKPAAIANLATGENVKVKVAGENASSVEIDG